MNTTVNHAAQQLGEVASEAAVIAGLAWGAQNPNERTIDTASGKAILLREPDGSERLALVDELAAMDATAGRIVERITVETQESLTRYAKRFKGAASLLLASISTNTIVAVLDYHEPRADEDGGQVGDDFAHAFTGHRATLTLPYSLEWKEWTGIDGKMLPQLDLCRFLEENSEDIRSPDAATVLEACRDLQSLKRVDFRSVVREDSENVRIEYAEEDDVRGRNESVTMPAEIVLGLPVYFDGEEHEVRALLRWKVSDGNLTLGVKLKRAERIRQAVFKGIVGEIAEDTGFPRVYGAFASRS